MRQPVKSKQNLSTSPCEYHPDVYKGEDAPERMRVLLLAYQTLSNPETRKAYDIQHAHHFMGVPSENNRVYIAHTVVTLDGKPRKAPEISPTARRDRQRHYAFPKLNEGKEGKPVHIVLGDMSYDLSADEARTLQHEGMLRGVETVRKGQQNTCHRCHHRWLPEEGKAALPSKHASALHAKRWIGLNTSCCAVATAPPSLKASRIRYEVGSIHYGDANLCPPYELFPLCPYCAAPGWCPAEDARVYVLRREVERKAAILRAVWLLLAVVVIIAVGAVMVNIVK